MDNDRTMNSLLSKIYSLLVTPDSVTGTDSLNKNAFVSFCVPGIPVPASALDFLNLKTKYDFEAAARFSRFVNFAPKPTGFWVGTGAEIWQIYQDALNSAIVEPRQLNEEQAQELKAAQKKLYIYKSVVDPNTGTITHTSEPSLLMSDYNKYRKEYNDAVIALNKVIMTVTNDPDNNEAAQELALNGQVYRQNVDAALQQWNTVKNTVEVAQETIANFSSDGPLLLFQSIRNDLGVMKMTDSLKGVFYPTTYFPDQFWNSDGWSVFTTSESEEHSYWHDETTSWGGGASAGWGLWSSSVGVSHTDTRHYDSCSTKNYKISFDLIQVPLVRPWLNPMLFTNRAWKLQNGVEVLSDGNPIPSTSGTLPLLPTSVLIIRNLSLSFDMTDTANTSYSSETHASGSVGWGPFSLRGGYDSVSTGGTHDYKSNNEGITCPGMQVIGFVCDLVPKSPNADFALLSEQLARFGVFNQEQLTTFHRVIF
jgi:hypothetical protein